MISERVNDGIPRNASTWFRRSNSKNPKDGGAVKTQELKTKKWLFEIRRKWADYCNTVLEGRAWIDHRSLIMKYIERIIAKIFDNQRRIWENEMTLLTEQTERMKADTERMRAEAGRRMCVEITIIESRPCQGGRKVRNAGKLRTLALFDYVVFEKDDVHFVNSGSTKAKNAPVTKIATLTP